MLYKALWIFNQLSSTSSMEVLNDRRNCSYPHMAERDIAYLNYVPDMEQYPMGRCAMGNDVFMFGQSSSSGAEAMNAANRAICECNNAAIEDGG